MFITALILTQFNPEKEIVLKANSLGQSIRGVLSQYNKDRELHLYTYFLKKNSSAEYNYEIYNKELLTIISCLEEWDIELQSVKDFTILIDYKNLEHFIKVYKLTKQQIRWFLILSRYQFKLAFRPGKLVGKPDALSRREQDILTDTTDERLQYRVT